ncbi:MAG: nucleotidyltransferase domain-containing protein [Muribaculaceae bacterium]|nr:nucleotidyltransferase domain-containing protein [Muribaculaceae bacterium]
MKLIELNMDKIIALCKKYKVAKLWVFGSILTDRFNDDSDVDFSVTFDKKKIALLDYADNYLDFHSELKGLLSRDIDLITEDSLRNPFFISNLNQTKRLIYG